MIFITVIITFPADIFIIIGGIRVMIYYYHHDLYYDHHYFPAEMFIITGSIIRVVEYCDRIRLVLPFRNIPF